MQKELVANAQVLDQLGLVRKQKNQLDEAHTVVGDQLESVVSLHAVLVLQRNLLRILVLRHSLVGLGQVTELLHLQQQRSHDRGIEVAGTRLGALVVSCGLET